MSLINDALKRASSQSGQPEPAELPGASFAAAPADSSSGAGKLLLGVGVLLVAVLCVGTFLFAKSRKASAGSPATAQTPKPSAAQNSAVESAPAASSSESSVSQAVLAPVKTAQALASALEQKLAEGEKAAEQPVQSSVAAAVATPPPAALAVAAKPEVVVPERAPKQPFNGHDLKLQAIYFRLKDPSALINGQTVRAGEMFAGGKVLNINRTSVEVEGPAGKQILLLK